MTVVDGLSALQDRFAGGDPVGVAQLLGMQPDVVERGHVAFVCAASTRFSNPMGTVHGGILATLLDSALGCAVQTVLDGGQAYTTVSLEVKYLRAVALDAGVLRAEGTVIHAGRRQATAEGRITDQDGRVVATATTTCLVLG
jgi:uncharacterized protein (TIGR00369 family)